MADAALTALIDRVQTARASRTPLCIRGGGSKDFYGEAPQGEPLDTRALTGISRYEPSELVVTVRAGTPLAELESTLAEQGQCLAFEPPRFADGGTVGGMVAAGLAGPARAASGGLRDYLLGATLLNGRAEVLSFGGQVMKNVAGYDVSRLLAGSMGILGVILEVSLKVLPIAPATITLRFEREQAEALRQLNAWGREPLPINASAWWSGMLVVRLSGASAAVQAAAGQLGGERIDAALADTFWRGLRDQRDEFFQSAQRALAGGATLWRLSVKQTAPPLALSGEQLIEWGGAQRWLVTSAPAALLREAAAKLGGHAVVFRGDKSAGVLAALPDAQLRIQRGIKHAFDPERIFNPGRLYPDL
ncbi:glycolate oxidase subunit GlcE [Aquincola sp. S2]|uniref:Glycolate oxidase subunit GlcE n=1 Tax=Pseudaquabacterium terrae TaxID=2732868 RepID=A0ABX2ELU3_9BURK|nr:glycolate oxidase subunit GlcE [Aquabacterium terrae]NRF69618.1 glycolate oxidase subunit GlcE [Aquabacterium terrae]